MSQEIVAGSVVTLKSGSGRMTVAYAEGSSAHCIWWKDGVVQGQKISVAALELNK